MNTPFWVRVRAENQGPLQQKKREQWKPQNMSICELLINLGSYDKAANRSFEQLRYQMTSPLPAAPHNHTQHNSPNKIPLMQLHYSPELPALQHLHYISIWMSTSEMATEQSIHWHRTKELIHNKHISRWSHASWPVLHFFSSFGHWAEKRGVSHAKSVVLGLRSEQRPILLKVY